MRVGRTSIGSRILSALLVVCMVLGMIPATMFPVFAADSTTADNVEDIRAYAEYLLSANFSKASSATQASTEAFSWDTEKKTDDWRYFNGVMLDALLMLGVDSNSDDTVSTNSALEFAKDFLDANTQNNEEQPITKYHLNEVDSVPPALVLFDLLDTAEVTDEDRAIYEKAIHYVYDQLEAQTSYDTQAGGNYLHKMGSDSWGVWNIGLDGVYMAQPFLMEYANALATGKITNANADANTIYKEVYTRLMWIADNMYDETTGLYHHGFSVVGSAHLEDTDGKYSDGVSSIAVSAMTGNGHFWSRGIGWYAAGLVMCIDLMPEGQYKTDLISKAKKLFDGMLPYQQSSGLWYNVVNRDGSLSYTYTSGETTKTGYNELETSGTALMAYAMMKAYNEGWVTDSKYADAAVKAFNGIVDNKLSDDGKTISGIYLKSGVGNSDEYYCKESYADNEAKGVGGVIMAAAEIDRYLDNAEAFRAGVVVAPEITVAINGNPDFSGVKTTVVGTQGTIKNLQYTEVTFKGDYTAAGTATVSAVYNGVTIDTFEVTVVDTASTITDTGSFVVADGSGGTSYTGSNSISGDWQLSKDATTGSGTGTIYSDYIDNESNSTDDFFTYSGSYKSGKSFTYNGTTLNKPLKMNSSGKVIFDSSTVGAGTLTLILNADNVGSTIKVDGTAYTIENGTDSNGVSVGIVTVTGLSAGSHTVTYGNAETWLGYVSYEVAGTSSTPAEYAKLIGEGTFTYEAGEKTADEVITAIQDAYDVYMGNESDGSDAEAQPDSDASWTWVDTYDAGTAGTYRVKVVYGDKEVELGTITVAVNVTSGTRYTVTLTGPSAVVITEGGNSGWLTLNAQITDPDGVSQGWSQSYTVTSADTSVATANGVEIKPVAAGETKLTVKLDSLQANVGNGTLTFDDVSIEIPVVVLPKATAAETVTHTFKSVVLSPSTVEAGKTSQATGYVYSSDGNDHTYTFEWYCWDGSGVASVDATTGKITTTATGTVTITGKLTSVDGVGTSQQVTATLTIVEASEEEPEETTYSYEVTNVSDTSIKVGESVAPDFTVTSGGEDVSDYFTMTLTSGNTSVAKIEDNKVVGVAAGTATITMTVAKSTSTFAVESTEESYTTTFDVTVTADSTATPYSHNFTTEGDADPESFFTFNGSIEDKSDVSGYTRAMKINSEATITFDAPADGELKLIFSGDTQIKVNDTLYTRTNNEVSVPISKGSVTVERDNSTTYLYYIAYEKTVTCEHSYSSEVTTAATCTTAGVRTYTCSLCSDTYTEEIAATGHNYVDYECVNEGCDAHIHDYAVTLTVQTSTMIAGSSQDLTITLTDNGNVVSDAIYVWKIVTNDNGTYSGTATLSQTNGTTNTLKAGDVSESFTIKVDVYDYVNDVQKNVIDGLQVIDVVVPTASITGLDTVYVGNTATYTVALTPSGSEGTVVWSCSGTGATIDANTGVLTATAAGTVTVTATVSNIDGTGVNATASKTVTVAEDSYTVTFTNVSVNEGTTHDLTQDVAVTHNGAVITSGYELVFTLDGATVDASYTAGQVTSNTTHNVTVAVMVDGVQKASATGTLTVVDMTFYDTALWETRQTNTVTVAEGEGLTFTLASTNPSSSYGFMDNLKLYKGGVAVTISNGDFESCSDGWTINSNWTITGYSAWASQDTNAEYNQTKRLSLWIEGGGEGSAVYTLTGLEAGDYYFTYDILDEGFTATGTAAVVAADATTPYYLDTDGVNMGKNYVILAIYDGKYYALTHNGDSYVPVEVTVANGIAQIPSNDIANYEWLISSVDADSVTAADIVHEAATVYNDGMYVNTSGGSPTSSAKTLYIGAVDAAQGKYHIYLEADGTSDGVNKFRSLRLSSDSKWDRGTNTDEGIATNCILYLFRAEKTITVTDVTLGITEIDVMVSDLADDGATLERAAVDIALGGTGDESNPKNVPVTFTYSDGSTQVAYVTAWAGIHNVMASNGYLAVLATDPVNGTQRDLAIKVNVQYGTPNTAVITLPESLTMTEAQPHVQLTPTVTFYDENGQPVTPDSYEIEWLVDGVAPDGTAGFNEVTVTADGIVSAVQSGTAVITATLKSVTVNGVTTDVSVSDTTNVTVNAYDGWIVHGAGWWTEHSTGVEITETEQSWIFNSRTFATADANWNTPLLVIYQGSNTVGGDGYAERIVIRSDSYYWCPTGLTAAHTPGNVDSWENWLAENVEGVTCMVTAKREGSDVIVTFDNNGLINTYQFTIVDTANPVYLSVACEECTATDWSLVTSGVEVSHADDLVLDGDSLTLAAPTVTYNGETATVTEVTYEIKDGAEYVTLSGSTVTGIAPGVATITAKVSKITVGDTTYDLTGAWVDFRVGVHEGWLERETNTVDASAGDKVTFVYEGIMPDLDSAWVERMYLQYLSLYIEGSSDPTVDLQGAGIADGNWITDNLDVGTNRMKDMQFRVEDITVSGNQSDTTYRFFRFIRKNNSRAGSAKYAVVVEEDGTYSYKYQILRPDSGNEGTMVAYATVAHPVSGQQGTMLTNYITVPMGTTTISSDDLNTLFTGNGMTIAYDDGTTATVTTNLSSNGTIKTYNGQDYIDVYWTVGEYTIQAPVYVQYSVGSEYIHNTPDHGKTSSFYTIEGDSTTDSHASDFTYTDHKGTEYSYDDGDKALKMNSKGKVTFTTLTAGKFYVVAATKSDTSNLVLTDAAGNVLTPVSFTAVGSDTELTYSDGMPEKQTAYVYEFDVAAGTAYTMVRSGDECGIYYMAYVPDDSNSITVEPPEKLYADASSGNHTVTLQPTVFYENVQLAGVNYTVEWSSDNTSVATVDSNGVVTAVGKGTANITAKVVAVNGAALEESAQFKTTVPVEVEAQTVSEAYLNSYDYIVQVGDAQTDIHAELTHMILILDYNYGTDYEIQYAYTADSDGNVTATAYSKDGVVIGTLSVDTSKVDTSKAGIQTATVTFVDANGVELFRDTVWIHVESYDYHDYDGSVTIEEGITYVLYTGEKVLPDVEYIIVGQDEDVAMKNPDITGTSSVAPEAQSVKITDNVLTVNVSQAPMVEWLIDTEVTTSTEGIYQYNVSNFLRYLGGGSTESLLHGNVTHVYIETCDASQGLYYLVVVTDGTPYYLEYIGGEWVANTSKTPVRLFQKKIEKIYDVPVNFEISDPVNGKTEDNRFQIPVGYDKTIELLVTQNDVVMDNDDCTFIWEIVDGEEYVTLDQNGNLVAVAEGQATIRVWLTHINDNEVICNVHDLPHIERDLYIEVLSDAELTGVLAPDSLTIGVGTAPNLSKVKLRMMSGETTLFTVGYENLEFLIADSDLDINTVGEYTVPVKYQGQTYSLKIIVDEDPYEGLEAADSIPSFPDAGAVRIDKSAQGVIDFNKTGVAEIELTAAGVSTKSSVDVVLIVDVSNSMGWTDDWFNYDKYGSGEGQTEFPDAFETYWTAYTGYVNTDAASYEAGTEDHETARKAAWADFVLGIQIEYEDSDGETVKVRGAKDAEKVATGTTDGYYTTSKLYSAMTSAKSFADILLNVEGGDNTLTFVTFAGHDDERSSGSYLDSVRTPFVSVGSYSEAAAVFDATKFTSITKDGSSANYYLDIGGHSSGDPAVSGEATDPKLKNRGNTNYDYAFGEAIDAVAQIKYNYEENNPGKSYDDSGRQLVVVFMTDGAPSHYNDEKSNGNNDDQLWYNSDALYANDSDKTTSGNQAYTIGEWTTFINEYNKYATTLFNEVGSIYTVGFDLDHGGFGDFTFAASALKPVLEGMVKSNSLPTTLASDKTQLEEYYKSLATSLAYAGTSAKVTDQIGTNFTLYTGVQHDTGLTGTDIVIDEETVAQINANNKITVKTYRLVTLSDVGKTMDIIGVDGTQLTDVVLTEEHLGLRITDDGDSSTAEEQIIETVTFSADGTAAYSSLIGDTVNILSVNSETRDVTIAAKTFTYTKDVNAVRCDENGDAVLDENGNQIIEDVEQFVWHLGVIDEQTQKPDGIITDWEIAISYYAYLEGSFNNPQKTDAAVFETNDFAYLEYVDSNSKYVKQTYEVPSMTWRDAVVTVKFFLVNENGEYVNLANVPFNNPANRYIIPGKTAQYTAELNGEALEVLAYQALIDAGLLGEYNLYDADAWAQIKNNVNTALASATSGGSVLNVSGKKDIKDLIIITENSGNGTNVNVTVEFPILIDESDLGESERPMAAITTVMDYGKQFPISVFTESEQGYRVYVDPSTNIKYVMSVKGFAPYDPGHDLRDYVSGYSYSSTLTTSNGTYRVQDDETILFTPRGFLENVERVFVAVRFEIYAPQGDGTYADTTDNYYYMYKQVNIVPATVMYYEVENNISGEFTASGTHETGEEGAEVTVSDWTKQPAEYVDQQSEYANGNAYGYDASYADDSTFSNGGYWLANGQGFNNTQVSFTFTGTGFEIISRTGKDEGTIRVWVYDADGTEVKKISVINKGVSELYQIPVVCVDGLTHGTYKVVIGVMQGYTPAADNTYYDALYRGPNFYFDAVRIYGTMVGSESFVEGATMVGGEYTTTYTTVNNVYAADGERAPVVLPLGEHLITADDYLTTDGASGGTGILYLDDNGEFVNGSTDIVSTYDNIGPNHEVYLTNAQGIAFVLSVENLDSLGSLDIGAKSVDGSPVTLNVRLASNESSYYVDQKVTINSSTVQYYDLLKDVDLWDIFETDNKAYVIIANGDPSGNTQTILSLTSLKIAYTYEISVASIFFEEGLALAAFSYIHAPVVELGKSEDGNWYYYVDGEVDTTYTGLVEHATGTWYVQNGQVIFSHNGMITFEGEQYYIKGGQVDTSVNGIQKRDGTWMYFTNGMVDTSVTAMVEKLGILWYVNAGYVDFNKSGLVEHEGSLLYVRYGQNVTSFSGLARSDDGNWLYVTNGVVDESYTGFAKYADNWWYVVGGTVAFTYTGTASNDTATYNVTNGLVDAANPMYS